MAVRFVLFAAACVLGAVATQAQIPPENPALPGDGALAPPGAAATAPRRQPHRPQARQGGADTRRIQGETDELYREIMRRSTPPGQR